MEEMDRNLVIITLIWDKSTLNTVRNPDMSGLYMVSLLVWT